MFPAYVEFEYDFFQEFMLVFLVNVVKHLVTKMFVNINQRLGQLIEL